MGEVFLLGGVRTPQGKYGGALAAVRPDDLAALVVGAAVARAGVPGDAVDEVVLGAANQAGEDNRDVARMAVLLAGLPDTRARLHGQPAVRERPDRVAGGRAGGALRRGRPGGRRRGRVDDPGPLGDGQAGHAVGQAGRGGRHLAGLALHQPARSPSCDRAAPQRHTETAGPITLSMGETAEEVAALDGITRDDSDAFALRSHKRAVAAAKDGRFDDELLPVPVPQRKGDPVLVTADEGPRADASLERLAGLRPVFRPGGIVTAGNSSPLSDGAAALVVASERAVREHGLEPVARVVTSASAGVAPHVMGLGPVPATEKALDRAGWSVGDLDAVELNEAFAAQSLACVRRLGLDPRSSTPTAARSRSATRWAAPGPGSPSPC